MTRLTLYTTLGCHLCEQLEAELAHRGSACIQLKRVEIAGDDQLLADYGERIPVLQDEQGSELERGFEPERLTTWLDERGLLAVATEQSQPTSPPIRRHGAQEGKGRRFLG